MMDRYSVVLDETQWLSAVYSTVFVGVVSSQTGLPDCGSNFMVMIFIYIRKRRMVINGVVLSPGMPHGFVIGFREDAD